MKRLFVAIPIAPDKDFATTYMALRKPLVLDRIKWVEPQNMHLTLKFLGKTPDDQIPQIHAALLAVASKHAEFDMLLNKTGIFGSSYQPRVIWLGDDDSKEIRVLGEDLLNELDAAGFSRDRQNFVPHLTLGRIKQINSKKHFQNTIGQFKSAFSLRVPVKRFVLFQSILKPQGPVYRVLKTYPLVAKNA
jgi:2'-5' RNA ligase